MDELDSDDQALTNNGRSAKRDIVQFVPFRKFMNKNKAMTAYEQQRLQYLLAKEVLAEVPAQVVSCMKSRNVIPRALEEAFIDTFPSNFSGHSANQPPNVANSSGISSNQPNQVYPNYPPENPPAYFDVINDPGTKFEQQIYAKASAP
uniref:Copine C-terminal domain-containing protein n=1 Tax=Panagrolaimus sp. JU765 TaxID=591449 RepID=A0AC34RFZ5_9BILA